tara:strand:+ start:416 stop:1132 length:717 start_codon:yes stop_codon:yes gene_type:complete
MSESISLGIIVPFYNEEKFLEKSVSRLLKLQIVDQIVLVDDCSSDNSYSIAENFVKNNNKILLTKTLINEGKGSAVNTGLNLISTSHVIVHDADLEYFPEDIPEMYEKISPKKDSLILGSRTIGNKKRKNIYFYTYFGNKVLTLLFSILNNYKVSDIASCYWLVKVDTLKKINLSEKGFAIEVEVLSKFLRNKIEIIEVPIRYEARSYEEGKKIKFDDGIKICIKILKYCKLNILNKF